MCDCEELEFEDFELMLVTLSKKPTLAEAEAPVPLQVAQVPALRQRK